MFDWEVMVYALVIVTNFIVAANAVEQNAMEVWNRQNGPQPRYQAVASLRTADNYGSLIGQVQLLQYHEDAPTTLMGVIQLPPLSFRDQYLGLHIHEYGDITEGCKWIGRHYNPRNQAHGAPTDQVNHVGDLGNVSPSGTIVLINVTNPRVQLAGLYTVIGRSLVIHSQRDDLAKGFSPNSKIDGNAGYPIACGTIAIKGDYSPAAAFHTRPSHAIFYFLFFSLPILVVLTLHW